MGQTADGSHTAETPPHAADGRWIRLKQTQQGRTLLMLLLIPLYAACFVTIRLGLAYAPPLRFAALRLLVAGSALLLFAGVTRQPLRIHRRFWPWLLVLALTAGAFGYGTMFLSPGRAGAGIATVLGNTQPLILVVLGAALLGERITRPEILTVVLGLTGVVVISFSALSELRLSGLLGALFAFASAVSFAVAAVIMKRLGHAVPLLTMTAWQFLLGAVPLFALSAGVERASTVRYTPLFLGLLLLLGLGGTALTTAAWYWLIQRDAVGRLSLYLFLVPIVGVVLAVILLGEQLTLTTGAGITLTVVGVLTTLLRDARRPGTQRPPAISCAARAASSTPAAPPADWPPPAPR